MRLKIIMLITSCLLASLCLFAQKNTYQFSNLDISNGLSNNRVNAIYKDSYGFIWFGTNSGLNRYDGHQFKVFKHNALKANSLVENFIETINEGPDKNMWIFTHNGISVYNSATDEFSNNIQQELRKYKIVTNELTGLKKDREGRFWFLTLNDGIYCYDPRFKTTAFYNTLNNSKIALHSNSASDVVEDANNLIWIVYHDGVIDKLDSRSNKIVLRSF